MKVNQLLSSSYPAALYRFDDTHHAHITLFHAYPFQFDPVCE